MFQRALVAIAGVDRDTLKTCPATDKLWAAHLGFALALSFIVVLGISFHATGYMIADPWMRGAVSLVIALTVFMFDRALYQSDWFYQGFLWQSAPNGDASGGRSPRRLLRIAIRLAMSFGLAWVIAVFLELAIFSDTIGDKIKRDHVTANQPVFQKIEQYQAELSSEIEQRRKNLAALETLYRDELAAPAVSETPEPAQLGDFEQQIKALDAQENELRAELRQVQEQVKTYAADMNAEQLGQRLNASNSGRAGVGPRYQFAKQQKEVYEAQAAARESEIAQLRAKREDLRNTQTRIAADAAARRDQARAAVQGKRDALRSQVERAREDLNALEASRLTRVEDFRQKTLAASDFQKLKDDPLSRMTAYQELKSDPKDGETITLFSWMTKFLIIFLEIVPVVAKLFFSPPSVYAARVQAQVERERRRIERERDLEEDQSQVEEQMSEIAREIRDQIAEKSPPAPSPVKVPEPQSESPAPERVKAPEDALPFVLVPPARSGETQRPPRKEPVRSEAELEAARLGETQRPPRKEPARSEAEFEAAQRREMELLISGTLEKQMGSRPGQRRKGKPEVAPREDLSNLNFVLQDDIPQKP